MDEKIELTLDKLFCSSLVFMKMMNFLNALKKAVCCSNVVAIESVYVHFLPYFEISGKNNYVEIVLHHIYQYYLKLPEQLLHILRCNCTVPLYDKKSNDGIPVANWSIDGTIEMMQKNYHTINFHNDKDEGGVGENSGCILLVYCSGLFHTQEYQPDYQC